MQLIKNSDVPESMLGGLPWGIDLDRWQPWMLAKALDDGHVDDSPRLAAAIRAERAAR